VTLSLLFREVVMLQLEQVLPLTQLLKSKLELEPLPQH
jgi:hypothetical protein